MKVSESLRTTSFFFSLLSVTVLLGCAHDYETPVDGCSAVTTKMWGGETCDGEKISPVVLIAPIEAVGERYTPAGICSGSLIAPTKILTAAHCLIEPYLDARSRGVEISFAVRFSGPSPEMVYVIDAAIHPEYRPSQTTNSNASKARGDVAVLTLSARPAHSIAPLPLLGSMQINKGDELEAFGYGLNEKQETGRLRAITFSVSNVSLSKFEALSDGKVSVCPGDSGGPALIMSPSGVSAIAGVASYGLDTLGAVREGLCTEGPAKGYGFVDVQESSILDFITSIAPEAIVR